MDAGSRHVPGAALSPAGATTLQGGTELICNFRFSLRFFNYEVLPCHELFLPCYS